MSSNEFQIESLEQKEMRKKILELASQECDNIQSELYDWKTSKFYINPGSLTTKSKHSSIFDEKVEEIQNKLKSRRAFQQPDLNTTSNFEQKANQHSSLLTQELYTKQLQLYQEKHEIEVKNFKITIATLTEKNCRLEQENESIRENFKSIIAELEEKNYLNTKRLAEKDAELELMKGKILDTDTIVKLLEEKLVSAERAMRDVREKDYELNTCKGFYEKEKKRREIAENEYKLLIEEVKEMNERACEQIRSDCQKELMMYKEKVKKLERRIRTNDSRGSGDKESLRDSSQDVSKLLETNHELNRENKLYEEKCAELNKQLKIWKVKTLGMAERMLSLYRTN